MSIATELQRISQAKSDIKTAIKAKGVTVEKSDTIDTYASKVDEIAGGMTMANYAGTIHFNADDWAKSDTVVLDMPNLYSLSSMFGTDILFQKIKHLTIKSNTPILSTQYCFRCISGTHTLETVVLDVDTSECANFGNMFFRLSSLKRIEGNPIDFSSNAVTTKTFGYTYNVEHFRVVPNSIKINADFAHCTMIDDGTVQSIINGLADLTGSESQTITWHSNIKSKLTDEQIANMTGKNWTVA